MDYEQTQDQGPLEMEPVPVPPPAGNVETPKPPAAKKVSGWRIFWGIVTGLSMIANIFLLFLILALAGMMMSGPGDLFDTKTGFVEETLIKGPSSKKIVVIRLQGIIDSIQSAKISAQFKAAAEDSNVRAVIVRTMTPGGTVSASDQIHYEITKFRRLTGKPVIAFMQSVAASGGYYSSVACDKIIAEPTVITGSIGVIMNNMVLKTLLEEKLGVQPVTIKSGPKKDWPSMYSETTEEQKQYLMDKLINPAYNRFVNLVAQGRKDVLTIDDVRRLADGSIYGAEEAMANKLIDDIGYFDKAVATAEKLASTRGCRVVEYARQFSLSTLLGAESETKKLIDADMNTLHEMATPQLLYLWDAGW